MRISASCRQKLTLNFGESPGQGSNGVRVTRNGTQYGKLTRTIQLGLTYIFDIS
jgi:hypothetical protein